MPEENKTFKKCTCGAVLYISEMYCMYCNKGLVGKELELLSDREAPIHMVDYIDATLKEVMRDNR